MGFFLICWFLLLFAFFVSGWLVGLVCLVITVFVFCSVSFVVVLSFFNSCKLVSFALNIHSVPPENICVAIHNFLPVFPSPLSIDGLLVSDGLFILESALKQK